MWTVVLFRPGGEPNLQSSCDEFTQGVMIASVDGLLIAGWHHHIDVVTKALVAKYVAIPGLFLVALYGVTSPSSKYILHRLRENGVHRRWERVLKKSAYTARC